MGAFEGTQWFNPYFEVGAVHVIEGDEPDEREEGSSCCRERPVVYQIKFGLSWTVPEGGDIVTNVFHPVLEEVTFL